MCDALSSSSSIEETSNETSRQMITTLFPASSDQNQFNTPFEDQELQKQIPLLACRSETWCGFCIMEIVSSANNINDAVTSSTNTVSPTAAGEDNSSNDDVMVFTNDRGDRVAQSNLLTIMSDDMMNKAQVLIQICS